MVICDTLIFNMQQNLEPLLSLLMKPSLSEEDVQECKKVVYKLQAMEARNDSLPLPVVTLKGKNSKKEDQYKHVWTELDVYVEGASKTSPMHKKVLDCLRGTQDPPLPPPPDMKPPEEPKAVPSTDKNRAEAPSERKAKEVPSDPRRRRRTSESSSTTNQKDSSQAAPITPKKSPRHDEPASKLRKTGSRSALNTITPVVKAKSSLLSIWTNHLNLTASRYHEEFFGRKVSGNRKFDLYAADADPTGHNDSKSYGSKGSSKGEW